MKFYNWNVVGDFDRDRCFLDAAPHALASRSVNLSRGLSTQGIYPADPRINLSEEYPGLRLESFIGNVKNILVVSSPLRALLEQWCKGMEIEYLPVHIYNHRDRLHTSDYSIINPLGALDCLDPDASEVVRLGKEILSVERIVLSPQRLKDAPPLFRILEDPSVYVVTEPLARALHEGGFTNVVLHEMETSDS
ncbi:hypothetical protein G4177_32300 [Corallococcus sp. ZKHCc1 1396]|uniref:Uncharacterized protein n=1 Tax=Corallococcus soli TaxID=2710757 RepID=A0ABR9PY55_9BACT|nr:MULTISPECIES: DUF1629 domain-containing protein [Corallococcus]MBE4752843.1 hypothetical protein [Corallococcus soli]MCY1032457.1 hypothetical protein [Corallococcus sp. BB11-1]